MKFLLDLSDRLRFIYDPKEINKIITKTSRKYFKSDRCYYGEIDGDKMVVRMDSIEEGFKSEVGEYDWVLYPSYRALVDRGKPIVVDNVYLNGPVEKGLKEVFTKQKIIFYIMVPVIKKGKTLGLFIISQAKPREWTESEINLAKDIAGNLSLIDSKYSETTEIASCNKNLNKFWDKVEFYNMDGTPRSRKDIGILRALKGEKFMGEGMVKYKKTGKTMYREFRASPIRNDKKEILGAVVISMDIAQRIKAREALIESERISRQLWKELKKTDELRLNFLSSLSHELRNPLAAIKMGLEVMEKIEDEKEEVEIRGMLKRQTEQLTRLVNDLLDITRITQNKFKLKTQDLDLSQLLRQVIRDNSLSFSTKSIEIKKNISRDRLLVKGDPIRLRQVVENILHNALKFTPRNGKVYIKLKKRKKDKTVVISIKDNGAGMSQELIKNIFKPYVQAKNKLGKSSAGLGIGLPIVKDIVDRHKGHIEVKSQGEGKGTEFIIYLPSI